MIKQIEMITVAETAARTGASEFAVRGWVRDGSVKSVKSGRKILINWESVLRHCGYDSERGA